MQRGSLLAFTTTFLAVAGTVSFYLIGAPDGTFDSLGGQIAVLVGGVCLLAGVIALLVHHFHGDSSQSDEIQNEAGELTRSFLGALYHLFTSAFFPLWLLWGFLLAGIMFTQLWVALVSLLAISAWGAIVYPRLVTYLHSSLVPNHHYNALRIWLWATHLFALATYVVVVNNLAGRGEITESAWLVSLSGALGLGLSYRWLGNFSLETFLAAVVSTAWVIPTLLALNFALDFRGPEKVEQVTYRECLDVAQTPPWELAERFQACRVLPYGTNLDVRAELTHWRGGLGFRWREAKRLN
jgi:hypothetical protein